MRLLNRLNQYQRLWQPSAGKPQTVTVSELAERCFCSERHVRTLLRQAQEAGWLEWQAQSGRGKRGQLRFLVTPESLRNAMMEQALETGKQQDVLELAQLAPGELRTLLQPFMGGQWQNDTPTLRIPYYRPLEPLQPGFLPGRAEQHLAVEQVHREVGAVADRAGDLPPQWTAEGRRRAEAYRRRGQVPVSGDEVVEPLGEHPAHPAAVAAAGRTGTQRWHGRGLGCGAHHPNLAMRTEERMRG